MHGEADWGHKRQAQAVVEEAGWEEHSVITEAASPADLMGEGKGRSCCFQLLWDAKKKNIEGSSSHFTVAAFSVAVVSSAATILDRIMRNT